MGSNDKYGVCGCGRRRDNGNGDNGDDREWVPVLRVRVGAVNGYGSMVCR